MATVRLPNSWQPRWYQIPLWDYWITNGGNHAECVWHRRSGKDDVVLHGTAVKSHQRVANYWHMLPLANQARKAIWDAVNPHTGIRRIDEAFPHELRASTRDNDMLIRFKNGSSWQVLGSDNFQAAVGSAPAGITYSEWALANPSARGYLRPILAENNGYEIYITTPRGKNHAHSTLREAQRNPDQFGEILTIHDTGILTPEQLKAELREYVATYGEAFGIALFEQEFECSFDAAIIGAIWAEEIRALEKQGRVCEVPHDPEFPVHAAFDIGFDDDTAIWIFQVIGGELRVLEYYANSGKDVDHYCSQLLGVNVSIQLVKDDFEVDRGDPIPGLEHRREYRYASINLPHDAKAKTLASRGKSVQEQFSAVFGWGVVKIAPHLSLEDGIQAGRKAFQRAYFDYDCEDGLEALRSYHREWDDDKKMFSDKPVHDWTSHPADAWRYLGVAWKEGTLPKEAEPTRWPHERTFNEMLEQSKQKRVSSARYVD